MTPEEEQLRDIIIRTCNDINCTMPELYLGIRKATNVSEGKFRRMVYRLVERGELYFKNNSNVAVVTDPSQIMYWP